MSKISKITVDFWQIPNIPVHFPEILYRENTCNFRKIFDRQNFSTFDFRHLPKVENFGQTHGLNTHTKSERRTTNLLLLVSDSKNFFQIVVDRNSSSFLFSYKGKTYNFIKVRVIISIDIQMIKVLVFRRTMRVYCAFGWCHRISPCMRNTLLNSLFLKHWPS